MLYWNPLALRIAAVGDVTSLKKSQDTRKAHALIRYAPLALIALGLVVILSTDLDRYLSFKALKTHHEWLTDLVAAYPVSSGCLFLAVYALSTAVSVPGASLLTIAGGFLFGTWLGGGLAVVGATTGAVAIYLAARTAFGDVLSRRLSGSTLDKLREGFAANGFSYLLSLRLIPLFPFWLINLAPAFLGVGLRTFTLATAIGILPGTFIYAGVGGGLGATLAMGEEPDFGIIFNPEILLPLIGLGLLSLAPIAWKRFAGPKQGGGP